MAFLDKVKETAKAAAKKSSELVEVTKLNMSIGAEEDKIKKVYTEMGMMIYNSYSKGEKVADVFNENCEKIKTYEENIKEIRNKIMELKNVKICQGCGAEIDAEVVFCSKCGAKQDLPQAAQEQQTGKACPACGSILGTESVFCTKCGAKVG